MNEIPTLLLVHGSWHGPWCWEKLTPELERLGLKWVSVDLPCCGTDPKRMGNLGDDAAVVEAAAEGIAGDIIVVAHSYGGVVATQAQHSARVKHLVYLGAFMPDLGQSLLDLLPPGPLPPFVLANEDGTTRVNLPLAIDTFYADCDATTADWAVSQLRLHNGICNVTPVSRCAWRETPSTYIVLTQDHASPPVMQERLARQAAQRLEMATSHSPFLSQPAELAGLLAGIAQASAGQKRRAG